MNDSLGQLLTTITQILVRLVIVVMKYRRVAEFHMRLTF